MAWLPAVLGQPARLAGQATPVPPIWNNPAALPVTLFMGLQSLVFYAWLTWLAKVLQDRGVTLAESGALLAIGNVVQLPFTLAVPMLAVRRPDQRWLITGAAVLVGTGLLGLLLFPAVPPLLWVLLGAGSAVPSVWPWPLSCSAPRPPPRFLSSPGWRRVSDTCPRAARPLPAQRP